MIHRSTDAAFFNAVANHETVRPFLGGEPGPLDLTAVVENPAVVALRAEHGGWIYSPLMSGAYELHTLCLPEGRGRQQIAGAKLGFRHMFAETDCLEILTKCPDDNGPARWASSYCGFRERFHRPDAWEAGVGVSYRAFTVDDWMARDVECLAQGQAFHAQLEAAKAAAGSDSTIHADDPAHDRAVGAALLMARAGQIHKGAGIYNRWAGFAGYAQIEVLSPTVLDIRDALIELRPAGALGVMVRG